MHISLALISMVQVSHLMKPLHALQAISSIQELVSFAFPTSSPNPRMREAQAGKTPAEQKDVLSMDTTCKLLPLVACFFNASLGIDCHICAQEHTREPAVAQSLFFP